MNVNQLEFVCTKLGFTGNRKKAVESIIIYGVSAYASEMVYEVPKGTANRDAIKCSEKWGVLLSDAQSVNDLLTGEYNGKASNDNLQAT